MRHNTANENPSSRVVFFTNTFDFDTFPIDLIRSIPPEFGWTTISPVNKIAITKDNIR